jgi:hypothetical protein
MDRRAAKEEGPEWNKGDAEMQEGLPERGSQSRGMSFHRSTGGRGSHLSRSGSKSRYNQTSANQEGLAAERKSILSKIFQFYTSFGERTNLKNLRSNKFHKMMQDCSIPIPKTTLDLLFVSENHHK